MNVIAIPIKNDTMEDVDFSCPIRSVVITTLAFVSSRICRILSYPSSRRRMSSIVDDICWDRFDSNSIDAASWVRKLMLEGFFIISSPITRTPNMFLLASSVSVLVPGA